MKQKHQQKLVCIGYNVVLYPYREIVKISIDISFEMTWVVVF